MTNEEKQAIETMRHWIEYEKQNKDKINKAEELIEIQETVLNLVESQQKELEKKDKLIDNAISEIEVLRQYFSEDLQPDFIRILEILKDKKVIDW